MAAAVDRLMPAKQWNAQSRVVYAIWPWLLRNEFVPKDIEGRLPKPSSLRPSIFEYLCEGKENAQCIDPKSETASQLHFEVCLP